MSHSVDFFDRQFQRQVRAAEYALNPFERMSLDYLRGDLLELGCGLGNLALEAARRGCTAEAVDASATAITRVCRDAQQECLAVHALEADLRGYRITRDYDTIIAIGLLMFFRREQALGLLAEIKSHVRPGGCAIVNVLVEGTTYMDMFTPGEYYLFRRDELAEHFAGFDLLLDRHDDFPAPGNTVKSFATVVARKK